MQNLIVLCLNQLSHPMYIWPRCIGTFDFTMFMADVIAIIYDIDSMNYLIGTIVVVAVMVITSTVYACLQFRHVSNLFNYQLVSGDAPSDETINFDDFDMIENGVVDNL